MSMKKLLSLLGALFLICPVALMAQEALFEEILERRGDSRISLDYECRIDGPTAIRLSGRLLIQDDCYYAEGNGLHIYCDGKTRWTADYEAKELYIENAESIETLFGYKENIMDLKLKNVSYKPQSEDLGAFRFSLGPDGSDWVITDLR